MLTSDGCMKWDGLVSEFADHDIPHWYKRRKKSPNLTYAVRLNEKSTNVQQQFFMTMVFLRDVSLL